MSVVLFSLLIVNSSFTLAKVAEDQAQRLNQDLTPVGAERAGNADNSIPPWTGGITTLPKGYIEGDKYVNPFEDELPMFTINAKNREKYRDHLTTGQMALLKQYPDSYFMPVYPTHRTASYPKWIYKKLKDNALNATLEAHGNGVKGTIATSPFPIPHNGLEVVWNHILRFRGEQVSFRMAYATPTEEGSFQPVLINYEYFFAYSEPNATLASIKNTIFYLKTRVLSPAKLAGNLTLIHETLDKVLSPRKAWRYESGQRRLRRIPNLAYSTDLPNSSGLRTVDQKDMYNGAPNQYNWKLLGKKEIYIPYNDYKLDRASYHSTDLVLKNHMNQKPTRYELHRVWVVEGDLREGLRHVYHKRRLYLDEDSWQIVLAEDYDKDDKLWRVSEAHTINFYNVPTVWTTVEVTYDLKSGRYYIDGIDKEKPFNFHPHFKRREFTASAVRREARR
jgi:hypothetical protein